jgi:glutaredoxin-related protein
MNKLTASRNWANGINIKKSLSNLIKLLKVKDHEKILRAVTENDILQIEGKHLKDEGFLMENHRTQK